MRKLLLMLFSLLGGDQLMLRLNVEQISALIQETQKHEHRILKLIAENGYTINNLLYDEPLKSLAYDLDGTFNIRNIIESSGDQNGTVVQTIAINCPNDVSLYQGLAAIMNSLAGNSTLTADRAFEIVTNVRISDTIQIAEFGSVYIEKMTDKIFVEIKGTLTI